ncbi:MAG: TIGR03943 family protein [Synergistaceae bacterium]|jgi:putative membrane protein|nr:TIGR03943 family protein [Synergistaceae bacterium]
MVKLRTLNAQVFLETLCCVVFSGLVAYLVWRGRYLYYVTPRMKPYLYFTAAVMLIWACAGLPRLFAPRNRTRSAHCFSLAVPILLLVLPHSSLNTSDLSYNFARGGILGLSSSQSANGEPLPMPGGPGASMPDDGDIARVLASSEEEFYAEIPSNVYDYFTSMDETGQELDLSLYDEWGFEEDIDSDVSYDLAYDYGDDSDDALSGLDVAAKRITISDDEFYQWLDRLFFDPDPYEGYVIRMTGFVLKDPKLLEPDEFVPARLVMSCCVADLLPFGMICRSEYVGELQADSWVTVEGVIRITEENGYREPQAWVTEVVPADEVEGYIYPF